MEALGTNLLEDPAIKGIVLNIRDVTEQKRADMEKQALYEILQGMTLSQNLGEFLSLVHYSIERILQARNLFVSLYNPNTGLMGDGLRSGGHIPTTQPYSALGYSFLGNNGSGPTVAPAVLAVTGNNAIVDWVVRCV